MGDLDLTTRDLAVLSSPMKLMEQEWAPCRYNCPVHADVRTYIELAAQGRWKESVDVVRRHLPFAAVCGRICHHPCEQNCRRNEVDKPVAIREVKRFVAEYVGSKATVNEAASQNKARVAVVGAGPAGMSAALELAKLGYRPTIFEKFPVSGGIPATAIPKYRLPQDVVKIDTDWILAHGIKLQTNVEVGKDKTISQLLSEGFEAILVATGLAKSRMLQLPGTEHNRVLPVMEFLTSLVFGEKVDIGNDVLVIGGGNVACDAARSAVRLGAKRVRMMCLENQEEMPAWEWEINEAEEEGISVIHRRGPAEIVIANNAIKAVKARKVTRVFDNQKRFNPAYDDNDVINIECDTVIFAIGQMADWGFIQGSNIKLDQRGGLQFTSETHQTDIPNVFACGEIVTPPGSVVEACANGRRAAKAIDMYLNGKKIEIDDALPPFIDKIASDTGEKVTRVDRVAVLADEPEKRKKTFDEFEYTYSPLSCVFEARRCMNCGSGAEVLVDKCIACLTCLRVCPFDIPKVTDIARIDSAACQACGICIAECPAAAIIARGRDKEQLKRDTAEALQKAKDINIVVYICGYKAEPAGWRGEIGSVDGTRQFYLPSLARLSVVEILNAFEKGAGAVVLVACEDDSERYPKATGRIRKRVNQAKTMLAEVGIDDNLLKIFEVVGDVDSISAAIKQGVNELNENKS